MRAFHRAQDYHSKTYKYIARISSRSRLSLKNIQIHCAHFIALKIITQKHTNTLRAFHRAQDYHSKTYKYIARISSRSRLSLKNIQIHCAHFIALKIITQKHTNTLRAFHRAQDYHSKTYKYIARISSRSRLSLKNIQIHCAHFIALKIITQKHTNTLRAFHRAQDYHSKTYKYIARISSRSRLSLKNIQIHCAHFIALKIITQKHTNTLRAFHRAQDYHSKTYKYIARISSRSRLSLKNIQIHCAHFIALKIITQKHTNTLRAFHRAQDYHSKTYKYIARISSRSRLSLKNIQIHCAHFIALKIITQKHTNTLRAFHRAQDYHSKTYKYIARISSRSRLSLKNIQIHCAHFIALKIITQKHTNTLRAFHRAQDYHSKTYKYIERISSRSRLSLKNIQIHCAHFIALKIITQKHTNTLRAFHRAQDYHSKTYKYIARISSRSRLSLKNIQIHCAHFIALKIITQKHTNTLSAFHRAQDYHSKTYKYIARISSRSRLSLKNIQIHCAHFIALKIITQKHTNTLRAFHRAQDYHSKTYKYIERISSRSRLSLKNIQIHCAHFIALKIITQKHTNTLSAFHRAQDYHSKTYKYIERISSRSRLSLKNIQIH